MTGDEAKGGSAICDECGLTIEECNERAQAAWADGSTLMKKRRNVWRAAMAAAGRGGE